MLSYFPYMDNSPIGKYTQIDEAWAIKRTKFRKLGVLAFDAFMMAHNSKGA